MKEKIGIYIHIPFCFSKCYYCDFVSYTNKTELIEKYIDALCNEIIQNAEILSEYQISTIYIGGGTPSFIDSKYISKIMNTLNFFRGDYEYDEVTIEVNPNSITYDKAKDYKDSGINRISIGLQSTHDDILKKIGRAHTYFDFIKALENIKKAEIKNVSVDFIYPLPMLTKNLLEESLDSVMNISSKYNINHISIYNLEIHEDTKLKFLLDEGFLDLPDEDEEYLMKELIDNKLTSNGFYKYEISNYAKSGFESKHNTKYWNQDMYLGFGVNASSFFAGSRYSNTKELEKYIYSLEKNIIPITENIQLDKLDLMKEYVILKLRLVTGVSSKDFYKKFGIDVFNIFGEEIKSLVKKGLLVNMNDRFYLSKRGMEVANIVWQEFIP